MPTLPKKSDEMIERLREEFEELFPKDQSAIDGTGASKSNRGAGLVLWSEFMMIIRQIRKEQLSTEEQKP